MAGMQRDWLFALAGLAPGREKPRLQRASSSSSVPQLQCGSLSQRAEAVVKKTFCSMCPGLSALRSLFFLSGSCSSFPQAGLICGPWTALRIMENVAQHRTVNYINFMRFLFWLFWSLNCTVLGYELCSDNFE